MPAAYVGPAPPLKHTSRARPAKGRPSVALRLRVRWNAAQLDAALADGADPGDSKSLALRAQQLAPGSPGQLTVSSSSLSVRGPCNLPSPVRHFGPIGSSTAGRSSWSWPAGSTAALHAREPSNPLRPAVEAILAALDR